MQDEIGKRRRVVTTSRIQIDHTWNDLYRAGAIAATICVVLFIVSFLLIAATPLPPLSGGVATLQFIAAHRSLYIAQQVLWLAPCLFALVVALALAAALTPVSRGYALIAGVVGTLSWALGLAWPATGAGSPVLVYLSDQYMAASTVSAREAFAGAAESIIALNVIPAAIGVMQATGILIIGLLMARGIFARSVAYLGIVTGVIGLPSEALRPVLGGGYALYGTLLLVWFAAVGWALARLSAVNSDEISHATSALGARKGRVC